MSIKSKSTDAKGLDQLLDDMKKKALRTRSVVRDDKRENGPERPRARMIRSSDTIR